MHTKMREQGKKVYRQYHSVHFYPHGEVLFFENEQFPALYDILNIITSNYPVLRDNFAHFLPPPPFVCSLGVFYVIIERNKGSMGRSSKSFCGQKASTKFGYDGKLCVEYYSIIQLHFTIFGACSRIISCVVITCESGRNFYLN